MLHDLNELHVNIVPNATTQMLIIGSEDDMVVPSVLIYDNFDQHPNIEVKIMPNGQHALGFFEAGEVYKQIISFIDDKVTNKNSEQL